MYTVIMKNHGKYIYEVLASIGIKYTQIQRNVQDNNVYIYGDVKVARYNKETYELEIFKDNVKDMTLKDYMKIRDDYES